MVQSPLFRGNTILHFIWKSRSQNLEEECRGTESMLLEVQWEVSTISDDLGCHVNCWCWSTVFSEVHSQRSHLPGNLRKLHASFCWHALWRCRFLFPAGLGTCPHCQRYQKLVQWAWCYCAWLASKLAWSEPYRESVGYCQEEDERHQTQQCRWPEGRYQSNLGFHYTWAVPQADCLHATQHIHMYISRMKYIIYEFNFLKWVTQNIDLFHDIQFFKDVPVCQVKSSQVELYCHSATCVDIWQDEMSGCLTGPRCYINTDIQHEVKQYKPIHNWPTVSFDYTYAIYKSGYLYIN